MHKKISSMENHFVRRAVEVRNRRRGGQDYFLAEGPHLVEMAAASSAQIEEVFFTADFARTAHGEHILTQLSRMQSPPRTFLEVTANVLSKISDTETPQGMIAIIARRRTSIIEIKSKRNPLITICDGVADPGNLGTIIRVSDAAGADAVVVMQGSCDPFSPKAVRATAGSIFNLPVISTDYPELIGYLADEKIDLIVTNAKSENSLYGSNLKRPVALAFGNEARGVSEAISSGATAAVGIPILGKAESLNVAVAASICLYEAVRQRLVGQVEGSHLLLQ
jgi:TrmH family RNA methyltransferase